VTSFCSVKKDDSYKQESHAVTRKPCDAAAVLFRLKFANNIHYKYITLNDHFTVNFHYYKLWFQQVGCILIIEPIYRIFLYDVTSRDLRKQTVKP